MAFLERANFGKTFSRSLSVIDRKTEVPSIAQIFYGEESLFDYERLVDFFPTNVPGLGYKVGAAGRRILLFPPGPKKAQIQPLFIKRNIPLGYLESDRDTVRIFLKDSE